MATDNERIMLLERRLDTLENIELIKKLKSRYVRACDLKNPEEIRDCFIPDASIDFTMARWDNRDDFVDYYIRWGMPKTKIDIHHAMNGVIDITGPNSATGVWSLYYFGINLDNGIALQAANTYWDEYVLREGRWWIKACRSVVYSSMAMQVAVGQPLQVVEIANAIELKGPDQPPV
jgi:SnoaL-like domain